MRQHASGFLLSAILPVVQVRAFIGVIALCLTAALAAQSQEPSRSIRETGLKVSGKAAGMLGGGRVSPDGRYVSFADQLIAAAGGTGNLAIWDIKTGETSVVTRFSNVKPWGDGFAEASTWMPDGKALVYTWRIEGGGRRRELRVVDFASGQHTTVFQSGDGVDRVVPLAVSPDGEQILTALGSGVGAGTLGTAELAVIAAADGTKRTLRTFDGGFPNAAAFSPDGRWIAFDHQRQKDSASRDVLILSTNDRGTEQVLGSPDSHDLLLEWLPDGRVLFSSFRAGQADALAVSIVNGRPQGSPTVLARDVGELTPQGVTRDGRVFVQRTNNVREVYIAEVDPSSGRAIKPATPLPGSRRGMYRSEPAWSPDGSRIAYVESGPGLAQEVVVQSVPGNQIRRYAVRVRNIDWPLWQPDGRAFIFDGTGVDNVQQVHRLWLDSGKLEPLIDGLVFGVTPDSKQFFHGGPGRDLTRRSFYDGTHTVIATRAELGQVQATTLSRDGKWLAYLTGTGRQRAIAVRPAGGGSPRVLLENVAAGYPRIAWTPDSKFIVFFKNPGGLHRVALESGSVQPLDVNVQGTILEKSVNADGRRIAFGVSRSDSQLLAWDGVLDNKRR